MNEREQIISFLLQSADAKNRQIEQLQQQNAELQKKVAAYEVNTNAAVQPVPVTEISKTE